MAKSCDPPPPPKPCPMKPKESKSAAKKAASNPSLQAALKYLLGFLNSNSNKMSGDGKAGRPMRYPYTLSAKLAQFPWKFHIQNSWQIRYYLLAVAVCVPVFYKLGKLSYAPANVKKWDEIRQRELSGVPHHHH